MLRSMDTIVEVVDLVRTTGKAVEETWLFFFIVNDYSRPILCRLCFLMPIKNVGLGATQSVSQSTAGST